MSETIYQQAYAPVPMEGRGLVVDYARATGDLTIYAATQSPHEVRLFCSRLLGMPEHRIRVVMRDTGGGFGQKVMVQRDEMCLMLAAPKVGAPLKWVEDRRENLLAAGQSRHEHAAVKMAFDADGAIQAAHIDFVSDCGAYPTPWPVGPAAAVGMLFPGPYRVPRAGFATKTSTRTPSGAPRTAARGSSRRWRARCCSTSRPARWAWTRSSSGAATCCAATSCRTRTPTACRTTASRRSRRSSRRWRCSTTTRSARSRPRRARSRPLPRRRRVQLRRAVDARLRLLRDRGGDDPHRAVGRGQRVHRGRLGREQHRDDGRAAHRRRARREHRRRQHDPGRHRRHRLRRGRGREPERVDDGRRGARDRRRSCASASRAIAAHKLEAAVDDIELADSRASVRGTPAIGISFARDRRARVLRAGVAAARRPGRPRGERALHRRRPDHLGERHARVHVRGRRRRPAASRCCATS